MFCCGIYGSGGGGCVCRWLANCERVLYLGAFCGREEFSNIQV